MLLRFNIFSKGSCDWHGFILGGRALDVQENDPRDCEVVFQVEGALVDIATSLWPTGVSE